MGYLPPSSRHYSGCQGNPDAIDATAGIFACGSAMSCCEKAGEWRVALQLLRQMKEPWIVSIVHAHMQMYHDVYASTYIYIIIRYNHVHNYYIYIYVIMTLSCLYYLYIYI